MNTTHPRPVIGGSPLPAIVSSGCESLPVQTAGKDSTRSGFEARGWVSGFGVRGRTPLRQKPCCLKRWDRNGGKRLRLGRPQSKGERSVGEGALTLAPPPPLMSLIPTTATTTVSAAC